MKLCSGKIIYTMFLQKIIGGSSTRIMVMEVQKIVCLKFEGI